LPLDVGTLRLEGLGESARLPSPLHVRFRRGGESLRLSSGGRTRELRDLFQEAGIPPWKRGRMPLLFDADDALVAVADVWLSEAGAELLSPLGARIVWTTADNGARPGGDHLAIDLADVLS
jgi:tRNA(Ile)-lysidine synthase